MLTNRVNTLSESITIAITTLAQELKAEGKDILSFSAGEPDFGTPQVIKDANSVVVKPVPNDATAIGIPAHVIEKGRCKDPLMHNMLPDINKEMFEYLLKRVAILEHILNEDHKELLEQDLELEDIYKTFITAMKN